MEYDKFKAQRSIQTPLPTECAISAFCEPEPVSTHIKVAPENMNLEVLQNNLGNCIKIIDNEVMKDYISELHTLPVIPLSNEEKANLNDSTMHFFKIKEIVYEKDEFAVHKLATVFHSLLSKPCTLSLMIQSDGMSCSLYLGVRARNSKNASATMKKMLEHNFKGLFPGSKTELYPKEALHRKLDEVSNKIGSVSCVTNIADFKQIDKASVQNKDFVQGLEKFIDSMKGNAYTAIFIAKNLDNTELNNIRREYEQIYTQLSPFANMQMNFTVSSGSSTSDGTSQGVTRTDTKGTSSGTNSSVSTGNSETEGTNQSQSASDTLGTSESISDGVADTKGRTEGGSSSDTHTETEGTFSSNTVGVSNSTSVSAGASVGYNGTGVNSSVSNSTSVSTSHTTGTSQSTSDAHTEGTNWSDSTSHSISKTLTHGINSSHSDSVTTGINQSKTQSQNIAYGTQEGQNQSVSNSFNLVNSQTLINTFGDSQGITLNAQNKTLISILERLDRQLERLNEFESMGMWNFSAYFIGESPFETETAANTYRSVISGNNSGIERSAVNTWIKNDNKYDTTINEITDYILNFEHPKFKLNGFSYDSERPVIVDASTRVSTNELAIHMGLPRKSVRGLPVIEHAEFGKEIVKYSKNKPDRNIPIGKIFSMGAVTETDVNIDMDSLTMHTFVTGSTGSGKSNTVYEMLHQLWHYNKIPFLVIEPAKGEYKNVFGTENQVHVYGTNPYLSDMLRINPFSFPEGILVNEHIERLKTIFNACWPMYAAMPDVLKDSIERAYVDACWDLKRSVNMYSHQLFPTFVDVLRQINIVMDESQYSADSKGDYKGALSTRLKSMTNGINGMIFTANELTDEELFDKSVIVDISRIGSPETMSLIMGLLIMKLKEHRMVQGQTNAPLKHITVLEEAHNLLKRTSTEQSGESSNLTGIAVETLTNAIAEMRTNGEAFIIADQSPGLLDMAVIRNTNTKIILRLPEHSDRELVGKAASLNDDQIEELASLEQGVAAIYQNDWVDPVLCKINYFDISNPDSQNVHSAVEFEPMTAEELLHALAKKGIPERAEVLDSYGQHRTT